MCPYSMFRNVFQKYTFKVYYGCVGYRRDMISHYGHSVSERLSKLKNAANVRRVTITCTFSWSFSVSGREVGHSGTMFIFENRFYGCAVFVSILHQEIVDEALVHVVLAFFSLFA